MADLQQVLWPDSLRGQLAAFRLPGRVIPRTQKMVLDASLLNTQHYRVQIKGKVEQSGKAVVPSPTPWCSSYRKGSLRVTLDYSRQLYYNVTIFASKIIESILFSCIMSYPFLLCLLAFFSPSPFPEISLQLFLSNFNFLWAIQLHQESNSKSEHNTVNWSLNSLTVMLQSSTSVTMLWGSNWPSG